MPRQASELMIALAARRPGTTIARWLYGELRAAILDGRLLRGARLPATRDLATRYAISRGVVVGVFEQLREEGYIASRVGAGTTVRLQLSEDLLARADRSDSAPRPGQSDRHGGHRDAGHRDAGHRDAGHRDAGQSERGAGHRETGQRGAGPSERGAGPSERGASARSDRGAAAAAGPSRREQPPLGRPFCPIEPALAAFPMPLWARLTAQVLARTTPRSLARGAPGGSRALREAVAAHLGASRGVACSPDHVVIVSGVQQGLDLVARLVIRPGDPVWLEDPGYSGAAAVFRNAGAAIVPVRVDGDGLDPADGRRRCARPAAVYLTPAHQFPLGSALSLDRRVELLGWAAATGAVLIEDDYDSEFRYSGHPLPAMKGLRGGESVFLLGTFNKALFPSLRLGYMVVPDAWLDRVLALRYATDLYPPALSEAVLAAFIAGGHFARHLRRMRELYGSRRAALQREIERTLGVGGALRLPATEAGLSTPAHLARSIPIRAVIEHAAPSGLDLWRLDRFALRRRDLHGFALGFAAFTERQLRDAVAALARAIDAARRAGRQAARQTARR
jgi:GntR family transcriptional regulator/MocR family aminotransferase